MADTMTKKSEPKQDESQPGTTYDNPELDDNGIAKPQPGTEDMDI